MDIQAYIQSGILESYVLGLTSAEENAEVERLFDQYFEVRQAIDEFALSIENQAFENKITPPGELKAEILAAVRNEISFVNNGTEEEGFQPTGLVVPFDYMRRWRMIAAASVMLFIVSAALNYYLYNKYNNKSEAYEQLLAQSQTLEANNQLYQTQVKDWQSAAAMMGDTAMATVKMRSPKGKDDAATVFWNTKSKDVFVMVNKLPEPRRGKQYQLWAIVDGKPVDAGVLDPGCNSVCKMKNIPRAQAFAITLEKEGGSAVPNLKALFVMGNT